MNEMFYFDNTNGVVTLRCKALDDAGFPKHCFTTRRGGVSVGYLAATNLSFKKEDPAKVSENYRRICEAVGFSGDIVLTRQEHTDIVREVGEECRGCGFVRSETAVDGFVTATPGITLLVFVADCVPVILADPVRRAIACVHSGWRGTAKEISRAAVRQMTERYGCDPRDMIAAVGPCIGACCYEVGEDVKDGFCAADPDAVRFFKPKEDGKYLLDLPAANRAVLVKAGLREERIYTSGECTFCRSDLYYSHRATNGRRGNMAAMIEL